MIFLRTTFFSGRNTLFPPMTPLKIILSVQMFDGVYNHLFLSSNANLTINNYNWDADTQMNATFDSNLEGSNSDFTVRNTDNLIIKRRELGATNWITIFVKEIKTSEDFNIHFIDKYAKASTEYEYCVSSYLNGAENSYVIENVYSDFDGYFITDKDCLYGTIYDLDGCDTSRNITAKTLKLLNSKYMHVVSNSSLDCDGGSITGTFLKIDENCEKPDLPTSLQYRNNVKDRLANHKPLILKIHDGRIWMIRVVDSIQDSKGGHTDIRQISFEWVEIGDVNDMETLYNYGFSDVDSRWW